MKLKRVLSLGGELYGYEHWCPGCKERHVIPTSPPKAWGFNGDLDRPSFTPSVNNTWTNAEEGIRLCCHYIMTDGNIVFCGDCTHELAGQTVPLPELPA